MLAGVDRLAGRAGGHVGGVDRQGGGLLVSVPAELVKTASYSSPFSRGGGREAVGRSRSRRKSALKVVPPPLLTSHCTVSPLPLELAAVKVTVLPGVDRLAGGLGGDGIDRQRGGGGGRASRRCW